jgi:gliding motility-associated-like protein
MTKQYCILVILLLLGYKASADIFTVTTNADNGTGSFREALTLAAANGSTSTDQVIFNITNLTEAGRTITILSQLPNISSNLIIDGSTQPGLPFGVSGAKIKLSSNGDTSVSKCFVLQNVQDVEIYGLYFFDFRHFNISIWPVTCAIFCTGEVKNIKIGAAGKGNVFLDNILAIANNYAAGDQPPLESVENMEVKANFFGIAEDGETMSNFRFPAIALRSFKNMLIGGDTPAEGNFFSGGFNGGIADVVYLYSHKTTGNGYLQLKNNSFGSNFTRTKALRCGYVRITGETGIFNAVHIDAAVDIVNNMFNNPPEGFSSSCNGMMQLQNIGGFINIKGNQIGNLLPFSSCQTVGINIGDCLFGLVGGETAADQNLFSSNYTAGLSLYNNRHIMVQQNKFVCNSKGIMAQSDKVTIPFVKILSTNNTDRVAGTATPNSTVEVFENPTPCSACNNGEKYLGKTNSDAAGNWSFTAPFSAAVTARCTTTDSISGEFSEIQYSDRLIGVTNPVCNLNNGSIKGMEVISGTGYYWVKSYNGQQDTIFNQLDIENAGPGFYTFHVQQTRYCEKTYMIVLTDQSPDIVETATLITNPSCGLLNGSIKGITAAGPYDKAYWLTPNRDTVSTTIELLNAGDGQYKLILLNTTGNCADSTGWITLTNQSGPTLNLNNAAINFASCSQANGSITGLTASNTTGSSFIEWRDSANNLAGNNFDLLNVLPGRYRVKFIDQSGCDSIISNYFIIKDTTAISINQAALAINPAGCILNTGSISGLQVTNASNYTWRNLTTNTIVGNTLNISGLPAAVYQLTASNTVGCSASSNGISIPVASFTDIAVQTASITNASCQKANGAVLVTAFSISPVGYQFNWTDSISGLPAGSGAGISALQPGTYLLTAIDNNGCTKKIYSATVKALPLLTLNDAAHRIINDSCNRSKGSITGITTNNSNGALTYEWRDINVSIAGTGLTLANVPAGQYQLTINDASNCPATSAYFTIGNETNAAVAPLYYDVVIAKNTAAILNVINPQQGTYFLYNDVGGTQLLQQNSSGIFTTPVLNENRDFYISFSEASCKSNIVKVKVTVSDAAYFTIPKAFTPNKDNLNDVLVVTANGYLKLSYFKIFNRYGQIVYSTSTLNQSWDGTFNGNLLPTGGYTWMAEGVDIKGRVVKDKGSILLLR